VSAPSQPTVRAPSTARRPTLDRAASAALAREELARSVRLLESLSDDDGARPTACPGWDVRAMASHVLGMTEMFSSYPRMIRQQLPAARATKAGAVYIDALTAQQVAHRTDLSVAQIAAGLRSVAAANVRWRQRTPSFMRNRAMPDQPVNGAPDAPVEAWTFAYLFDTVLTRDTWMHRGDISVATGRTLELTADHDGVLVEQVVAEWGTRHDQPYDLRLTGPAGGHWTRGETATDPLELDAVEFCRLLSGRGAGSGLLAVGVPF
jgi:uncharacterized protein (TIGR03083 family)